jgi:2-(1,2-epoxy-1,2-dihydrophenyl)acetyl-CoA isomerase
MDTLPHLLVDRHAGVLTLTLNRPESLNSLTVELVDELRDQVALAASDADVRCVVLTGAGRAFSSGHSVGGARRLAVPELLAEHYNPLVRELLAVEKPTVAVVNGFAGGAAASLTLACDFRVMAEHARYAFLFVRIGLVPDAGASWLLPRLIGQSAATELFMLGGDVDAPRALDLGLVHRVASAADLAATVAELTDRLVAAPAAIRLIKRQLRESPISSLDEQFRVEIATQVAAAETDDYREGVAAFRERRPAQFTGR